MNCSFKRFIGSILLLRTNSARMNSKVTFSNRRFKNHKEKFPPHCLTFYSGPQAAGRTNKSLCYTCTRITHALLRACAKSVVIGLSSRSRSSLRWVRNNREGDRAQSESNRSATASQRFIRSRPIFHANVRRNHLRQGILWNPSIYRPVHPC